MKINRIVIAVSIIVLVFGSIALSQSLGWWQTKNSGGGRDHETEIGVSESHEEDETSVESEDIEDHENSDEISGSSTVQSALDLGLTQEQIIEVLGEYDDETQLIKDVATANGLSFGKVKTALNELLN